MPTLRPLHDYSDHDVVNLFSWSGAVPASAGTMVKIANPSGWQSDDNVVEMFSAAGNSYANTVSQRYRTPSQITTCGTGTAGTKDAPIGMLLYDVREEDENGEKLIYHPRKAAENDWVISGQAAPILTRGVVLYSGATLASDTLVAGGNVYTAGAGELSNSSAHIEKSTKIGKVLGTLDANNHVLLKLEL